MSSRRAEAAPAWLAAMTLVLLLLAHRLLLLHYAFDDLFTPGYELFPMGVLGDEIRRGLDALPFLDFHDTHSGGQMLSSLVTAGAFALFGASYFALKLVPVLFAMLCVAGLFLFVDRWLGRESAWWTALLWVFGPSSYVDYSTSNYGNHSEVLPFVLLVFAAASSRLLSGGRPSARGAFLLGLACGLAVWYALSSLLVVALLFGLWLLVDRGFLLRRSFASYLAGAALGASPLFAVAALHDAPQAEWMEAKFAGRGVELAAVPGRLAAFFTDHLPRAAASHDLGPLRGAWLDRAWFALWVAVWVYAFVAFLPRWRWAAGRLLRPAAASGPERRDLALLLIVYPLALAAAYAASNFKIGNWKTHTWGGYRYLFTLFLVLALLHAFVVHDLLSRARRGLARGLAVLALLVGLLGAAAHPYRAADAGKGRRYPGSWYEQTGRIFVQEHWARDPERIVRTVDRLPPVLARDAYRGIGIYTTLRGLVFEKDYAFEPLLRRFPERVRPFLAQGCGAQAARHALNPQRHRLRDPADVARAARRGVDMVLAARGFDAPWLVQGLFLPTELLPTAALSLKIRQNLGLLRRIPPRMQRFARQGFGAFAGEILLRGVGSEAALIESEVLRPLLRDEADPELRSAFLVGVGYAAARYLEDPGACDVVFGARFSGGDRRDVYAGAGWVLSQLGLLDRAGIDALPAASDPDARAGLLEGLEWRRRPQRFVPVRREEDPR